MTPFLLVYTCSIVLKTTFISSILLLFHCKDEKTGSESLSSLTKESHTNRLSPAESWAHIVWFKSLNYHLSLLQYLWTQMWPKKRLWCKETVPELSEATTLMRVNSEKQYEKQHAVVVSNRLTLSYKSHLEWLWQVTLCLTLSFLICKMGTTYWRLMKVKWEQIECLS